MKIETVSSWGRVVRQEHRTAGVLDRYRPLPLPDGDATLLAYGNGRSYGDSCLNPGGILLKTNALDHMIRFDTENGLLTCEAGILLSEILRIMVPRGWFLPVTPGTRFITVGGAIANDVHGKNHHLKGTFGSHVKRLELLRSDGSRITCSRNENFEWFSATIGGLGLTGLITWVEFALLPVRNPWMAVQTLRFGNLDEFFSISSDSDTHFECTVAWIDCCAKGSDLGRGLFIRGNHAPMDVPPCAFRPKTLRMPFTPPISLVNAVSLRAFNMVYYHKQRDPIVHRIEHYEPFFYPLDGISDWNRIYGPRGFYQYQCVVPQNTGQDTMREVLRQIGKSGQGSFLAVLKYFGKETSPGMLSFPMKGLTLALDFPNTGKPVHQLFHRLDALVSEAKGRLYPAKDARMPGRMFREGYPRWERFSQFIDPRFSSGFWRRVMEDV